MLVFVDVVLDRTTHDAMNLIEAAAQAPPEILEYRLVAGGFDDLVETRAADMAACRGFVGPVIWSLPRRARDAHACGDKEVDDTTMLPIRARLARGPARYSSPMNATTLRRLTSVDDTQVRALADVLCDCVLGGASVGFMAPLSVARAATFWRGVAASVNRGERALLVAEDAGGTTLGTVQLVLAQPENQPHRADVAKMLVHRRARQRGVGAALLQALEAVAVDEGKSLLVLDTVTCGDAERLYARLGWQRCGVIPGYALWPAGGFCATTVFYKALTGNTLKPTR